MFLGSLPLASASLADAAFVAALVDNVSAFCNAASTLARSAVATLAAGSAFINTQACMFAAALVAASAACLPSSSASAIPTTISVPPESFCRRQKRGVQY